MSRFSFTAPQAGNYSIVVSNNGSVDKFLYYYGIKFLRLTTLFVGQEQ